MKVGIIVQARMGSSRLPGKVLRIVGGKELLLHHIDRLKATRAFVVVATTTEPADQAIVDLCTAEGVATYRGSEEDVLGRFHDAAVYYGLDIVVRTTADCPFISAHQILNGLAVYRSLAGGHRQLLVRSAPTGGVLGFSFEIFSFASLSAAASGATAAFEREHVTPYFYHTHKEEYIIVDLNFPAYGAAPSRLTWEFEECGAQVDTEADLQLVTELVDKHDAEKLNYEELLKLLHNNPALRCINQNVKQKHYLE